MERKGITTHGSSNLIVAILTSVINLMVSVLICWVWGPMKQRVCQVAHSSQHGNAWIPPQWESSSCPMQHYKHAQSSDGKLPEEPGHALGSLVVHSLLQVYAHCLTLLLVTEQMCLTMKRGESALKKLCFTCVGSASYHPFPLFGLKTV